MRDITYSFVIPHHNTPNLLQRLIDSIPQREDIEIIVVDDNSEKKKKANINRPGVKTIFIDKEHTKGAGHARNLGMDAATGKWLLFADADDLYKPNFIEVLDEYKDDDIEILYFNMDSVDSVTLEPKNRASIVRKIVGDYDGSPQRGEEVKYLSFGPWRKMILSDFVRRYGLRYEEISRGNDVFFSLQTAYFVDKFKVDKRIVYTNTYRVGSIVHSKTTRQKYIDDINRTLHIYTFFKFIGHQDFNRIRLKEVYHFYLLKYFSRLLLREPIAGLQAISYYCSHFVSIYKNANYYVDTIKSIEDRGHLPQKD